MPKYKVRKTIKIKGKKQRNNVINYDFGEQVELTNHVVEQAKERRPEFRDKSKEKIKNQLIHEIKNSKLVGLRGNEEHRNYYGNIYACKRENGKLVAITYLLSKNKENYNTFYNEQRKAG